MRKPLHIQDQMVEFPPQICDAAIAVLDQATNANPIDDTLLEVANRQALKREIIKTVDRIKTLELDTLLSRQSWLSRFTGAALEERLKFEVAVQKVSTAFATLKRLSDDSTRRIELMRAERNRLAASLPGMSAVIDHAQTLLNHDSKADQYLIARFENKLANLITMQSANQMAIEQFKLAEKSLISLNDRFLQISNVLFPMWQQQVFAILHAPGKLTRKDKSVVDFLICHEALEDYFTMEART